MNSLGQLVRKTVVVLLISMCVLAQAAQNKLTLSQVEELINKNEPDDVVASEIQKSGVNFIVTAKTLKSLRGLKAGDRTIQALQAYCRDCSAVEGNDKNHQTRRDERAQMRYINTIPEEITITADE